MTSGAVNTPPTRTAGGHSLACPRCHRPFPDERSLKSHLHDFELLTGVGLEAVLDLARNGQTIALDLTVDHIRRARDVLRANDNPGPTYEVLPMPEKFPCPKCEKSFVKQNGLSRHLHTTHGVKVEPGKPTCSYCKRLDGTHSPGCKRSGAGYVPRPRADATNGRADRFLTHLDDAIREAKAELRALERIKAELTA